MWIKARLFEDNYYWYKLRFKSSGLEIAKNTLGSILENLTLVIMKQLLFKYLLKLTAFSQIYKILY